MPAAGSLRSKVSLRPYRPRRTRRESWICRRGSGQNSACCRTSRTKCRCLPSRPRRSSSRYASRRRNRYLVDTVALRRDCSQFLEVYMGFFATFWTRLNGQLAAYIGDNTTRLAGALEPAVLTFATLYVMAWGYLHLMGKITEPFEAGLKRIALVALVLGVGLRLWLYNTVIVDSF